MWKIELIRSARDEYDALSDSVRGEALILLEELAEDPFPEGVLVLRGHRDHYRLRFYGNQYQVIYRLSKTQKKAVVTRIRRKDQSTYSGYQAKL